MLSKVLIVDDDQVWLRLIKKKFEKFADRFTTLSAKDGQEAIKILGQHTISLVATDLQMPVMDGLTLLAHLSESYPDIPVIIMTAYSNPKAQKAVKDSGAFGYIEKPFAVDDLAEKILVALKRESEGGTLQTMPLEVFVQLIAMEQKTCTIRVVNKSGGPKGVLFFRYGELLEARIHDRQGEPAAYEIFAWENVTLAIQDDCALKEKRIRADLQAILFEAMRRKDESRTPLDDAFHDGPAADGDTSSRPAPTQREPITPSRLDQVRRQMETIMGHSPSLQDVYTDSGWDRLIHQAARLGQALGAGAPRTCYIDNGAASDFILMPDDGQTIVAMVSPKCARDQILQSLSS